jgi:hypothetical protein
VDLLDRGGAGRNQRRIDLVILGPLQVEHGISPHLGRLKHDDQPLPPQLGDDSLLIAATRLDPNPFDLVLPQPFHQHLMAIRRVVGLKPLRTTIKCNIELAFAGIDPGTDRDTLGHLPRPSLVSANLKFVQPSGSR